MAPVGVKIVYLPIKDKYSTSEQSLYICCSEHVAVYVTAK